MKRTLDMTRRIVMLTMLASAVAGVGSNALAQKPVSQGAAVTETSVIVAIDSANRLITLKDESGDSETIYAPPEM